MSAAALPARAELRYALCADPGQFAQLAASWSGYPELWIDTETADWQTSHPRLSLLQVRTPEGGLFVVDMLAPGMREILEGAFVPVVMANSAIRKWAHSASYERRFLGGERVQNLQCTVRLAKSIPYHRLPVRQLTLAALCGHLFGTKLDKSHQKDDWGVRPLSPEQLAYAAADPEWCRRVQEALDGLVVTFEPWRERPQEVRYQYVDVNARLREKNARRGDIRDAVRDHLLAESREGLGGFRLHRRVTAKTTLRELVRVADELDPGHTLSFDTAVPKVLTAGLDARARDVLRESCSVKEFRSFRGPRVPGREPREVYPVAAIDEAEVDRQYAEVDDARRRLDSEREELRCRMKGWMEMSGLDQWEGFAFSEPTERWSADMRTLIERLPSAGDREVGVPLQFRLAFGGGVLDRLDATNIETAFVTWRERLATRLDPEASQSRDWHAEADEPDDAA